MDPTDRFAVLAGCGISQSPARQAGYFDLGVDPVQQWPGDLAPVAVAVDLILGAVTSGLSQVSTGAGLSCLFATDT